MLKCQDRVQGHRKPNVCRNSNTLYTHFVHPTENRVIYLRRNIVIIMLTRLNLNVYS